jgi:tRNA (cmo5U34)-methyltransferase
MAFLDFDGDYGRQYNQSIRQLIPAYDVHFELAGAALRALVPTAQSALVVGPGAGAELPSLLSAMPGASLQLVEPSEQMRGFCDAVVAQAEVGDRIVWAPSDLKDVAGRFDATTSCTCCHRRSKTSSCSSSAPASTEAECCCSAASVKSAMRT